MGAWDRRYLGWERFPDPLTDFELDSYFLLTAQERGEVAKRRGALNRFGIALQIGFIKMTGCTLNGVQLTPRAVLALVAGQIGSSAPDLASIRSLYKRRRTLYEHQTAALELLGLESFTDYSARGLTAYLRREALSVTDNDKLLERARAWISEHGYVQPGGSTLTTLIGAARQHLETMLREKIIDLMGEGNADQWLERLSRKAPGSDVSMLEWLRTAPQAKKTKAVEEEALKIAALMEFGADKLDLATLPEGLMRHYAGKIGLRKPSGVRRIKEPRRTVEIACFLRHQLCRLSDQLVDLHGRRLADLWRGARSRAEETERSTFLKYRGFARDMATLAAIDEMSDAALGAACRTRVAGIEFERDRSKVARIRQEFLKDKAEIERLTMAMRVLDLKMSPAHPLASGFASIDQGKNDDRDYCDNHPFGRSWDALITSGAPGLSEAAMTAACALALKRGMRNGSVSIPHSFSHRSPNERLIPKNLWERHRGRFRRTMGMPASGGAYVDMLTGAIEAGLQSLQEAIDDDALHVRDGRFVLPKLGRSYDTDEVKRTRRQVWDRVGEAQLPGILIDVDAQTRFSWILLGGPPQSDRQLITLYAALMALGSDLTPIDVARMIPTVDAVAVGQMMKTLIVEARLGEASVCVNEFMRSHAVTALWGAGVKASADMMSLEASRHLWTARVDPRRRKYAVGTYTHVLDQWGVIHDQPIVPNRRQVGAAIEGALRQKIVELERLAVDTHGYSNFGIALAKLCGFDLCVRLAKVSRRKLYVPKGVPVSDALAPVVSRDVATMPIKRSWDDLLRVACSVRDHWCDASFVMEKFGSAARGTPVFEAGDNLGKVLCTIFLCDYLGIRSFDGSCSTI